MMIIEVELRAAFLLPVHSSLGEHNLRTLLIGTVTVEGQVGPSLVSSASGTQLLLSATDVLCSVVLCQR